MQTAYYSSGLTKEQILRIRAEQKELYGPIRRSHANPTKGKRPIITDTTADLNVCMPSKASEFYWLVQHKNNKNVTIFRKDETEIAEDVSTVDRFEESPPNETL